MEKISEIIKRLCPEGVEKVRLGQIIEYEQPSKYIVKNTDYKESGIPVLTAGQSFILGYTDELTGIFHATKSKPTIIFDDFTTSFHWVDFDFKVKSSAMKMLNVPRNDVSFRYVYYAMREIVYEPVEHSRQWISQYSNFEIPLPPLSIQQEIVRVLDSFTAMITNLETELASRQKQYEHYRNMLLAFDENSESVEWKTLGDIGEVRMCKRILKSQTNSEFGIPFYKIGTFGKKADAYISKEVYEQYKDKYNYPKKGDILISAAGTIGRTVEFDGTPSYFQDSNIVWIEHNEKVVTNKYLKEFYEIAEWKIQSGGSVSRLYNDNLKATIIPVPSLQCQKEIVEILDTFEALITNIKRELEARKKQYEYFREKLLTFE